MLTACEALMCDELLREERTTLPLPLPLRERVGERGGHERRPRLRPPLSPALPRKGGGSAVAHAAMPSSKTLIAVPRWLVCCGLSNRKGRTALSLPLPLRE